MPKFKNRVVLFALIMDNKVLVEKRPIKGFINHQYLIPGGSIKDWEMEKIEDALKREMMEELAVIPLEYELLTEEEIPGLANNVLKPFVIKKWEGEIPDIILDKEDPYPLEWIVIDSTANNHIDPSRKIIKLLEVYLLATREDKI